MDAEFWHLRWQQGQIGFHEGAPNAFLVSHAGRLGTPPRRIFVPLCGKTRDLAYLAGLGHRVVGVELSPLAAEAFFAESGAEPTRTREGAFERFAAGSIEILVGDFFALDAAVLGEVDAAYDRAALVALPPDLRARYAAHEVELLPSGAPILLVAFDYDQAKMQGPPFSVPETTVRALYGATCEVEPLETRETIEQRPRFREAGLDRVAETAFLLVRR